MSPRKPGIALVGNVETLPEAELWEAQLRANGIPVLIKAPGRAGYFIGEEPLDPLGYDVFVPATALKRSREILAPSLNRRARTKDGNPRSSSFVINVTVVAVPIVVILFAAAIILLN
jgi:hypothetical protein